MEKIIEILLPITFVFGFLRLVTLTKIFDQTLVTFFHSLIGNYKTAKPTLFIRFIMILDIWFFYFSLCFQSWYWLFKK